jgi:hypothetical protein
LTLIRNYELFIIIILAITIQLVGYEFLAIVDPSSFTSNPIALSWLFLPVGSIIFGIGTVFAGGCAGGVCYRVGEGNGKSLLALLGFVFGIGILAIGPISDVFSSFQKESFIEINGSIPTLEMIFPRIFWTIISCMIAIFYLIKYFALQKQNNLKITHLLPFWTPVVSGIFLGLIGIVMKVTRNFSFSTVDGIGNLFQSILIFTLPSWAGFYILGLILGSFFSSIIIKEFVIKIPSKKDSMQFFTGGLILGLGAMMAGGCNFGHILGGIPELGLSSVIAFPLMILGNWLGSYLFYIRFNQNLPSTTPN